MDNLEVIARVKIRPGRLEGFRSQAAELLRVTQEQDTHTLRCDWFINEDESECEVHELFPDEQGLIEHKMNTMAATVVLFRDYAFDHHATMQVSPCGESMTKSLSRFAVRALLSGGHGPIWHSADRADRRQALTRLHAPCAAV